MRLRGYEDGTRVKAISPEGVVVECMVVGIDYAFEGAVVVYKLLRLDNTTLIYTPVSYILDRLG